jgi:diaminohydroxyphosphoribosylaminopyrimidine deaminase / 5-amino-6-(5-phosphoribosylamino)uracil reductase
MDLQQFACFALDGDSALRVVAPDDPQAVLAWRPGVGWEAALPAGHSDRDLLELYLPICAARTGHPVTVGHIGQSLDGYIATQTGESRFVTGQQNIVHLHRLRALADAVVVGAGTVAADDPRLTTRLVPGTNALRVVLDPRRRLARHHGLFTDGEAPTLVVCDEQLAADGPQRIGNAEILGVPATAGRLDLGALLERLRRRGCHFVFVEGGGVTVSAFLEAQLLDRLHVAVAPLLIGDGRPGVRLPGQASLDDRVRLRHRVFRMGDDILFDCDLRSPRPGD